MARWSKKPKDNFPVGRGRLRKLLPSDVWHFFHRNAGGHWVSRSTSYHDKAGAIRWAEAFSMNLTQAQFGIAKPEKRMKVPTVIRGLAMWLRYHRQQSSEETVRSYRSIGRKFWKFLRTKDVRQFVEVTRETLMQFRTSCLQKGNSRVTVDNNLIAIRAFLSWSLAKKWIGENPASESSAAEKLFFSERPIRKEAYTREEFENIITTAVGIDRHVFTLLGSWGLRISELAMLEWTDLDFDGGWVRIRNKVTHDGIRYRPKDKTDRKIPLEGKRILSSLDQLCQQEGCAGYVLPLPAVKSRRRHAERHFIKQLKRLSKQTGIETRKMTLHRFRHYFVSECADTAVPMAITMEWVGHDELKMVLYYYSLRDEPARQAMARLVDGWSAQPGNSAKATSPQTELPRLPDGKSGSRRGRRAS